MAHKDVEMHFKVVWHLQYILFVTINGHKQINYVKMQWRVYFMYLLIYTPQKKKKLHLGKLSMQLN